MKRIKLPAPGRTKRPVEVVWHDAAMQDGENVGMAVMRTVGYYIFKGRDENGRQVVRLASDLDGGEARTFHVIPTCHVVGFAFLEQRAGE